MLDNISRVLLLVLFIGSWCDRGCVGVEREGFWFCEILYLCRGCFCNLGC